MSEAILLQNDVVAGQRLIHLMSDAPIGEEWMAEVPNGALVQIYQDEIRLFHLVAEWKVHGDLVVFEKRFICGTECPVCHGSGCAWQRMVALFAMEHGERIGQAIGKAAEAYALRKGQDPAFAWVRSLPKGIEYGAEVAVGGSVIVNLFSADWMPERAVAVGR